MEVTALDSPVFANYFCYREKVADIPEYTEDMRCNELSAIVKTMKSEEMKQQASYRDILGHYGQIFFLVAKRAIAEKETMQKIHPFYKLRRDLSRSVFAKQCAIRIDKQQKERYNNVVIDNDVII